ncbi:hypothetical protein ON010_g3289 [Phytophthora cinnamomi]|nr:hypothetical protein ON010_g3289 [Phytophthora cinnamomi]
MKRSLRLMTWNVNGLRAVLQRLDKSLQQFLEGLEADIICLQETKMTRSELDQELVRPPGTADECADAQALEAEMCFIELSLASADRLEYKLQFHALLEDRVKALRQANKHVVVVGDINIAHREIDHCDPDAHRVDGNLFADHPCRRWMDEFVGIPEENERTSHSEPNSQSASSSESATLKLVDTFRYFHPTQTNVYTCWNTLTGARQTNYGTRLDYILVDPAFLQYISSCSIEAERFGSDHCPVVISCTVELETDSTANIGATAALCAKNFVEFSGTQQSIKSFVVRSKGAMENQDEVNDLGNTQASPDHTAGGVSRPKRRINQGQQSITSFFSSAGAKRKSPSLGENGEGKDCSSVYQLFSRGVQIVHRTTKRKNAEEGKLEWQQVLSGRPPPTPLCHCGQPTIIRSVVKVNENWGRKFYVCSKPAGEKGNPDARCEFFKWADNKGHKKPKLL